MSLSNNTTWLKKMSIIDFQKDFLNLSNTAFLLKLQCNSIKNFFQKNNTSVNQTEPSFNQLFELNNLKVELQSKDTTIKKLRAHTKRINETSTSEIVKKDFNEIETINIEQEHRVIRLIAKNEHLKQMYKQLYDLIKPSRVRVKEQTESLVNQVNQKKFKGKDIVDNAAQVSNATTNAPGMYKLDPVTLAPKDKNNRETHIYYLKHTIEQAAILREIVEQARSLNPLDSSSYSACKITATNKVPLREHSPLEVVAQESVVTKVYTRRPKLLHLLAFYRSRDVQIVLWYLDFKCSKHMTRDRSQLTSFVHKFLGTIKFGNDQIAKIMGYSDYQIGNITISRVYYVEGLGHNLFSVGQLCDSDLEVAF
ncbi:hypothetical protein Tco_0810874 [Tanacetum coccineum]